MSTWPTWMCLCLVWSSLAIQMVQFCKITRVLTAHFLCEGMGHVLCLDRSWEKLCTPSFQLQRAKRDNHEDDFWECNKLKKKKILLNFEGHGLLPFFFFLTMLISKIYLIICCVVFETQPCLRSAVYCLRPFRSSSLLISCIIYIFHL